MQETGKIEILGGNPERLGAYRIHGGYNFAVSVPGGVPAELLLYRGNSQKPEKIIPLPEKERTGQISAVCVKGLEPGVWEYSYRMGESRGADPYARILRKEPGKKSRQGEYRGVLAAPAAARLPALDIPYEDCLFYKTHVRGFTMRAGIEQKYRGTFRGVREMIPYLKELGVTSLLLMPVYEFEEFPPEQDRREKTRDQVLREQVEHPYALPEEEKPRKVQKNYWGYTGGLYFAPKASYSSSGCPSGEFAEMMDALHEAGIECILEFYFLPDMPSRTVLDILHYWRLNFQADGFHLLGEGSWIDAVTEDPLLKKTKLIYLSYGEERLARNGRQQICRNLAEMNMGYEELMRRFLKGDPGCTEEAAWFLRRNSQDCAYINYFADQDGFTMMDMVSYEQKHNEANGEDNRDGNNNNYTWNCGAEGPARKQNIRQLRMRQLRNAFLLLLTGQSVPMIYGGDEFLNSQEGNNNAWCQDNETGWLNWSRTKAATRFREFVGRAAAFRREHPVLRQKLPLRLMDYQACGFPDLSYHGERAWYLPMEEGIPSLGVLLWGPYCSRPDGAGDSPIYILYNMYWQDRKFALPDLPEGMRWYIQADSGREEGFYTPEEEKPAECGKDKKILVPARTVMILTGKQE